MSKKGSKTSKDTSYEYRDVVLAKVRGYPPWPGMVRGLCSDASSSSSRLDFCPLQVVDPTALATDVLKERPSNKKANFYCVRFFPKGDQYVAIFTN